MEAAAIPTTDQLDMAAEMTVGDPDDMPRVLGIPLNRILTIGRGPINIAAASLSSWLLVHVHLLGLFHVQHDGLSAAIAQGIIWIVTAVLTDRGIAQWVKGHHLQMVGQAQVETALVTGGPADHVPHPDGATYDPAEFEAPLTPEEVIDADEFTIDPDAEVDGPLPSDAEETAPPEGV